MSSNGRLESFLNWLGETDLAFEIGATWWFPLLETLHVLSVTVLVGSMIMVDLRLLGATALRYAPARIVGEHTPWAWGALVPAIGTGAALFISRPLAYAENPAFQIKLGLLILAGANVWAFHRVFSATQRDPLPAAVRTSAALSLILWLGVLLAGRWVGHLN